MPWKKNFMVYPSLKTYKISQADTQSISQIVEMNFWRISLQAWSLNVFLENKIVLIIWLSFQAGYFPDQFWMAACKWNISYRSPGHFSLVGVSMLSLLPLIQRFPFSTVSHPYGSLFFNFHSIRNIHLFIKTSQFDNVFYFINIMQKSQNGKKQINNFSKNSKAVLVLKRCNNSLHRKASEMIFIW